MFLNYCNLVYKYLVIFYREAHEEHEEKLRALRVLRGEKSFHKITKST